jgi:hypothetical protein
VPRFVRKICLGSLVGQEMVHSSRRSRRYDWHVGIRPQHVRLPSPQQLRSGASYHYAEAKPYW